MAKLNSTYTLMLRKMIRGGFRRKPNEWGFILKNEDLLKICKTESIEIFMERQRKRYNPGRNGRTQKRNRLEFRTE